MSQLTKAEVDLDQGICRDASPERQVAYPEQRAGRKCQVAHVLPRQNGCATVFLALTSLPQPLQVVRGCTICTVGTVQYVFITCTISFVPTRLPCWPLLPIANSVHRPAVVCFRHCLTADGNTIFPHHPANSLMPTQCYASSAKVGGKVKGKALQRVHDCLMSFAYCGQLSIAVLL